MKFTGRTTFQWVDVRRATILQVGVSTLGRIEYQLARPWAFAVFIGPQQMATCRCDTLDEAKAALLAALGIVVEWETPQGEAGP